MGAIQCCKQGDETQDQELDSQLLEMQAAVKTLGPGLEPQKEAGDQGLKPPPCPGRHSESAGVVPVDQTEKFAVGTSDSRQETTTISDSSRDNLEREKENLKALVQAFASRAVKGTPAGLVDLDTGYVTQGKYFVDRTLKTFTFRSTKDPDALDVWVAFRHVTSIIVDETEWPEETAFPGRSRMSASSLERLAGFAYSEDGASGAVALLLENPQSSGTFGTCMNVLRLYNE